MPLAMPISKRPTYKAAMLVVVIMITFDTIHTTLAVHRVVLRDMTPAMGPAMEELRKAPSVMSEEMSCCRSVEMFHPPGTLTSS